MVFHYYCFQLEVLVFVSLNYLIYNSIISNTKNKIKAGLNFSSDSYDEFVFKSNIERTDRSFGGFF